MFDLRKNHALQAVLVIILLWLVVALKLVLVVFFIAFMVTTVLQPIVGWLHKRRVPIGLAVMLPVVGLFAALGVMGYFIVPQVISEFNDFVDKVPSYVAEIRNNGLNLHVDADSLRSALQDHFGSISSALISATRVATEIVVGIVSVLVISLYWLGSYNRIQQTMLSYVPTKSRARLADIWSRIEKKLVSWLAAQVLLALVVGVLVWIGALILNLPFAGVLGIIAGLLEIIPTLGPIASAVPGVLLGLSISPETALAALVMYIIVQQIENHLLAPWLLGRTVHLSPIVIIFSLLVGAVLYGILGALLAVPIALIISSAVDSFREGSPKFLPSSSGK